MALGPAALTFESVVKLEEVDPVKHTARLQAEGTAANGRGSAHGTFSFRLEPSNGGSKVLVHTDLVLSGQLNMAAGSKWSRTPPHRS